MEENSNPVISAPIGTECSPVNQGLALYTTDEETKKHDRRYKDRQILTNFLVAFFTAVTAAVGLWQGCLTRSALSIADRQTRAAEESNQVARDSILSNLNQNRSILQFNADHTQALIAETGKENRNTLEMARRQQTFAFEQGKEALDTSKKNFIADQRAWIGPAEISVSKFEAGERGVFTVTLMNVGKTVAKNLHVTVMEKGLPWGSVFVATVPDKNVIKSERSVAVIFPNQRTVASLPMEIVLTNNLIGNVESGWITFRFWGVVTYEDNFGVMRTTQFCSYLAKDRKTMEYCDAFNDAS